MRIKTLSFILIIVAAFVFGCGSGGNDTAPTDPNELLAFLEAKIKQNPKDAELYYERGRVLLQLDQVADAINSLSQAVSLKSGVEKYHLLLADAYFRNGNVKESYSNLQEVLNINPKNIDAYMKIGEIALFSRDYDRSLESIDKALDIDNLNPKAYYMKGYLFLEKGDTTEAVRNLRKTIDIDNTYTGAYELLGLLFINRNDHLGVEYLTTATNLDPNNIVAMYALGLYYQDNADIEKAESYYNKVLTINPQHTNAVHNLGYIELVYKENYDKAIEYFNEAVAMDPENIEALTNRALAYEQKGDKVAALQGYKEALDIDPGFVAAKEGVKRMSK
ncbi:MAG: tetratricopeptide repeat protein [Bacteroidales bacterium]|nr:tetratricopeptide repeat protein [Bacteroidales bacterium]